MRKVHSLYSTYFKNKTVIGLSGVAGSGKDTFFDILRLKYPEFRRFALADSLKKELRQSLINTHNIDILSCSREDKNKIRDQIVSFAKQKRIETKGKHWTSILEKEILESNASHICITDIRHNFYEEDEVFWLKNKLGGKLINVELYDPISGAFRKFPNEEEKFHYPLVKAEADYHVIWPEVEEKKHLDFFVDSAIMALLNKQE